MTRRLTLLLALATSLPLGAQETQRYVVTLQDAPARTRVRALADPQFASAHRVHAFRNVEGFAADLTAAEVAELRKSAGIALVTPVVERSAMELEPASDSAESELASSWGVTMVRAPEVWGVTRGENIHVAVLDTGIDLEHPDLQNAILGGTNTLDPSRSADDDNKHGTHVAGIIGARANTYGVIGVAPAVKLWAVKVLDQAGNGTDETVIAGIDWVIEQQKAIGGIWVINLSLGSNNPSELEQRAVERALEQKIAIVAAAGNRTTWVRYPARYPGVIAVGAIDREQHRADFSSTGIGLSVMAPGAAVLSTMPRGTVRSADVRPPDSILPGWGLGGSPLGNVRGLLRNAGYGRPEDIPLDVAGHIALVQRGEIAFREKARNAKERGAIAVIIWNNEPADGQESWTMEPRQGDDPFWSTYEFPLSVGVQQDEGRALLRVGGVVEVGYRDDPYGKLNGTSMAAPHVAGIVALMRAAAPETPVLQLKTALERTAHDMEAAGWDSKTGWGFVDALAAAQYVAPEKFNVLPPPSTPSPRRRAVR